MTLVFQTSLHIFCTFFDVIRYSGKDVPNSVFPSDLESTTRWDWASWWHGNRGTSSTSPRGRYARKTLQWLCWLVVDLPLWKMMEFVSWEYYSQYIYIYVCIYIWENKKCSKNKKCSENKKCSKPPTSCGVLLPGASGPTLGFSKVLRWKVSAASFSKLRVKVETCWNMLKPST